MSIRVTYPNEGLYANGEPRFERLNKAGEITFSRVATDQEALAYGLIDMLEGLGYQISALNETLRNR